MKKMLSLVREMLRLLGCAILLWSARSEAAVVVQKQIEPYYNNDVKVISPPDGSGLQPFVIGVFRDKLRIGQQDEYETKSHRNDPSIYPTIPNRNVGIRNKWKGERIYLGLLGYGELRGQITVPTLKGALLSGANDAEAKYSDPKLIDWVRHTHFLATALLDDAGYRRHFCSDGVPCAADQNSGMRPYDGPAMPRYIPFWGGHKNEFRARESYITFVDTYATRLFEWGAALDRNVEMVALVDQQEYKFDRAGYVFAFTPAARLAPNTLKEVHTATYAIANKGGRVEVFVPMNADDGNALYKRLQESARDHKRLYAVYSARLTKLVRPLGVQWPYAPFYMEYEHEISGDAIEFMLGDDLAEPLRVFPLR